MSHHHRMPTKQGEACNIQQRQDAMLASNPPKQKQVEQVVGGSVGPALTFASGSKLLVFLDRWEQ